MISFNEWSPLLIYAGSSAALSGITFLLYRRWRTLNYYALFMESVMAAVVSLLLFAAAPTMPDNSILLSTTFIFSLIQYAILQAAFHFYFLKVDYKELIIHGAPVVLNVLAAAALVFNSYVGIIFSLLVGIAYIVVLIKRIIPILPKANFYRVSHLLFVVGLVLQGITLQWQLTGTWFVGQLLLAGAQFTMLLIFYDRIVDMVEAVSYHSVTDGLTGLYNRNHFTKKVKDFISNGTAQALIFVDIDNFKQVNDVHGHQVGDEILKLVAKTLKNTMEEVGLSARYGGEELVAIITSEDVDPGEVAEQFRALVEENSVDVTPVTVSVGYSIHEDEVSADELIKQADEALYKAKSRGKNRVVSHQRFKS